MFLKKYESRKDIKFNLLECMILEIGGFRFQPTQQPRWIRNDHVFFISTTIRIY